MTDKLTTAGDPIDSRTKCPDLDKMTDQALVNYAGKLIVKFASELRPVFMKVHERFVLRKLKGKPFLGYTDWDKFCLDFWNYTGRHVRRIINGEGLPKPRKRLSAGTSKAKSVPLTGASIWTD